MKDVKTVIESVLSRPLKEAVESATAQLLGEDIKVGQTVAMIDPNAVIGGYAGTAVVQSLGQNPDSCWVDVKLENGTVTQVQANLLVPVS